MPELRRHHPPTGLIVGIVALGALVVGVSQLGEAEAFLALARQAEPGWLFLAAALQATTYATEAGAWGVVTRRAGHPVPFRALYEMAVVGLFTSQAVPSGGLSGTVVVVNGMVHRGVPKAAAVSAVIVDLVGYYIAFGATIALSIGMLHARHDLPVVVLVMALLIVLLGTGICGGAIWLASPARAEPRWARRIPGIAAALAWLRTGDPSLVRDARLLAAAAVLRAGNFVADGLTLWACLRAIATPLDPLAAISACVVATLARTLGLVPGGLGTFEGGAVGGLALFGVAVEPALAATLLFRGLSFWLPMLPGVWLGRRLAKGQSPE